MASLLRQIVATIKGSSFGLGRNGEMVVNKRDGSQIVCDYSPSQVLYQNGTNLGIACSGTITSGGALTLNTNLNFTYALVWLYFPATAFATLPAGYYPCVMSGVGAGTVYSDATLATVAVGSGVGYTGDTTARTSTTITVPGGYVGANGRVRISAPVACNSSAGSKTITARANGTFMVLTAGTTTTGLIFLGSIKNANNQAINWSHVENAANGSCSLTGIDTSKDWTLTIQQTLAVATDTIVMHGVCVELLPAQ